MTKFKVGDRVRGNDRHNGTLVHPWSEAYPFDKSWSVLCDDGRRRCYEPHEMVILDDSIELAELRAWRDAAIAKHPDLAPVDPDLLEARKVGAEVSKGMGDIQIIMRPDCWIDGTNDDTHKMKLMLAAIKRGRELERAASERST